MKKHRILTLALILCMLLASCAGNENGTNTQTGENTADGAGADNIASTAENAETADPEAALYENLPTADGGGDKFPMLQYLETTVFGTAVHAEDITGEEIHDSIFERSAAVEKRLNIDIDILETTLEDVNRIVANSVKSGDNDYAVFWQHLGNMAQRNVLAGYVYDLNDVDGFDFSKPWWKSSLMREIAIGDKTYMACGDVSLYLWEYQTALVFNKGIMNDRGLEFPYGDVRDGTWTFDKFSTLVADVCEDLDGDGVYGEENDDLFALGGFPSMSFDGFFYGAGQSMFAKDENNLPYYKGVTDEYYDFYQKVAAIVSDKNRTAYKSAYIPCFKEGREMFYAGSIGNLNSFREIEFDYGLVPYPTGEEGAEYQSFVTGQLQPCAIPTSNKNADFAGIVLENLAAESHRQVKRSYFEKLQNYKYVRDAESTEMLDIIYSAPLHTYIDYVYDWGNAYNTSLDHLRDNPEELVSAMKKVEKMTQKSLKQTIEKITAKND